MMTKLLFILALVTAYVGRVVDEKGAELITDRKGNVKELGGKGPRFTMLSPGDKVYTASQTSSLLNAFDASSNMTRLPKSIGSPSGFDTATITRELKALQQIMSNKSESPLPCGAPSSRPQAARSSRSPCASRRGALRDRDGSR